MTGGASLGLGSAIRWGARDGSREERWWSGLSPLGFEYM